MRPNGHSIHLSCPAEAYAFVYADQVTMPSVSQYLKDVIATHLPENVQGIELNLRAEIINTPYYHYTHGLKKHDGNCQRIAHGHRSKISIIENHSESLHWQQYWADRWCDIYVGSTEDIVELSKMSFSLANNFAEHYLFAYQASQGWFELAIPKAESELVDTDTTVECLAQYIADEQKRLAPGADFKVFAYEGVGKGAIAYA
jgi:6-pyruvoyl-tetrahydropterin synthase